MPTSCFVLHRHLHTQILLFAAIHAGLTLMILFYHSALETIFPAIRDAVDAFMNVLILIQLVPRWRLFRLQIVSYAVRVLTQRPPPSK